MRSQPNHALGLTSLNDFPASCTPSVPSIDCLPLQGKLPDYNDPVVLPKNRRTLEDFCNRIHKGIMKQFKYALVWGTSVKHKPQKVGKDHVLDDEDIVQIVKKI